MSFMYLHVDIMVDMPKLQLLAALVESYTGMLTLL